MFESKLQKLMAQIISIGLAFREANKQQIWSTKLLERRNSTTGAKAKNHLGEQCANADVDLLNLGTLDIEKWWCVCVVTPWMVRGKVVYSAVTSVRFNF